MQKFMSCGILLFRNRAEPSFLLMRHRSRYDLPKGHVKPGESEIDCALRETFEETGVRPEQIALDPDFRFETTYYPHYKRLGGQQVEKTVVIFLGWVADDTEVRPEEHPAYEWIRWDPPHRIQAATVDPLLAAVASHWAAMGDPPR